MKTLLYLLALTSAVCAADKYSWDKEAPKKGEQPDPNVPRRTYGVSASQASQHFQIIKVEKGHFYARPGTLEGADWKPLAKSGYSQIYFTNQIPMPQPNELSPGDIVAVKVYMLEGMGDLKGWKMPRLEPSEFTLVKKGLPVQLAIPPTPQDQGSTAAKKP